MTPAQLEEGYRRAYRDFYRWPAIVEGALTKPDWAGRLRHFAYATGWKKFEPLWDLVLRLKRVAHMRPVLESVLRGGPSNTPPPEALSHSDDDRPPLFPIHPSHPRSRFPMESSQSANS